MARYVAFLRGINLGKRRPPMSQLKSLFEELGFEDVATFIASGNVIFSSKARDRRKLESQIEKHLEQALGYDVETFVRTAEEVIAVSRARPFLDAGKPGTTVHVLFFRDEIAPATARKFEAIKTPHDEFRVQGREGFWKCTIKVNESKVWYLPEFKTLPLPSSTMRNATSIAKLVAKHLSSVTS